MFFNVNLNNLENILQRNLRTGRARESIFGASRGRNFENNTTHNHGSPFMSFDGCTSLP